jgi:hypothetical protein
VLAVAATQFRDLTAGRAGAEQLPLSRAGAGTGRPARRMATSRRSVGRTPRALAATARSGGRVRGSPSRSWPSRCCRFRTA